MKKEKNVSKNSLIFSRQYRFPPVDKSEITKQVDKLLRNKIIKPPQSPYNTPVCIDSKKPDSKSNIKWRMVLDVKKLNKKQSEILTHYLIKMIYSIHSDLPDIFQYSIWLLVFTI